MVTCLPSGWLALGCPRRGKCERLWAKALCSSASGGGARGCRIPFGGIAVVPLTSQGLGRRIPLEGIVVELRVPSLRGIVIGGPVRVLA